MPSKHKFNPNAFIIGTEDKIIPNDQAFPPGLKLLQDTVGGDIEILYVPLTAITAAGTLAHTQHTPKVAQLIVNQGGQRNGNTPLPSNPIASSIAGTHIVGIAVLLIEGARIK